jgi:hypothetical protein
MSKISGLIFIMLIAVGALPTNALATSQDVLSTRVYIRAAYALQIADKASLSASRTAAYGLIGQVNSQCPNIMAGVPRTNGNKDVGGEILGSVLVAIFRPENRANNKFVQTVESLRWSSRKLERTVRSYATELKAQTKLTIPNLCADLKAWVASGYTALPASSAHFVQQIHAIIAGPGPGEVPLTLFAPYQRPNEKTIIRRTTRLEAELTRSQTAILEATLSQISRALGQGS